MEMSWATFSLAVFLLLGYATMTTTAVHYKSEGCFKDDRSPRPLSRLLLNLRPFINKQWNNFDVIIETCAKLAQSNGFEYFGIEFYGECWTSAKGESFVKGSRSTRCFRGVGKEEAIHVYKIQQSGAPQPKCGVKGMTRIIGGATAVPNAWPWQAELLMYSKDEDSFVHRCGGTLINPFWVVTAAHCVFNNIDPKNYKIRLGEHDRTQKDPGEKEFDVSVVHIHDRFFTGSFGYDIALMKLAAPAMFTNAILPACLPTQYQPVKLDETCFVTGWGMTKYKSDPSILLQQAQLPLVPDENCTETNGELRTVDTFSMLCAGKVGQQTTVSGCHGDSGGPLVCQETGGQWYLRGIVSWGDHDCSGQHYSVFTRVSAFIEWINCKMSAKPLVKPSDCVDAHFYCKQWKALKYCEMGYTSHLLKGYYCRKTCEDCI